MRNNFLSTLSLHRHNTHHYIELFKTIRQVLVNGNLQEVIDIVRMQMERRCLLNENIDKQMELDKENKNKKSTKSVSSEEAKPS